MILDSRFPKERIGVGSPTVSFLAVRGQVIYDVILGTPAPDLIYHNGHGAVYILEGYACRQKTWLVAQTRKWKEKNRRLVGAKDHIEIQTISRTPNKLQINFLYQILIKACRDQPPNTATATSSSSMGSPLVKQASREGCADQLLGFQTTCSGICEGSRRRRLRRIELYIYVYLRS